MEHGDGSNKVRQQLNAQTSEPSLYSPVYSPAPAGMPIRLGRSGGSVRRGQEAYVGL